MQRVEESATVDATPDAVFALLADLEALPSWQYGVLSARVTSAGPLAMGSTALVVRDVMGQRVEAPLTVSAYDPPRRLAVTTTISGVRAEATLDLAPAEAGTRIDFAMEIRAGGLKAFMEPMIASAARGEVGASLERLRARFAAG